MAGRDTDIEMNSNKITNNESATSIDHHQQQSYESIDNSGRGNSLATAKVSGSNPTKVKTFSVVFMKISANILCKSEQIIVWHAN